MPGVLPVYAIHVETVRHTNLTLLSRHMPARMEKAYQYCQERDRLLCIGAGLLLQRVLGIRDETELRTGSFGKPYAPGFPAFNLSHSGDWCILATGQNDIGADIEEEDEKHLSVAPAVFTQEEQDWIGGDPARFHMLWTLKESLMKATGLGFEMQPQSVDVLPLPDHRPVYLHGQAWYAATGSIPGYRFSVCGKTPIETLEWLEYE